MADTFLNTARTGMATSNVQSNINQVNNTSQQVQPIQQQSQQPTNQVSPITIPIQIQPQVQQGAQQNTQQNVNLQAYNNTQQNNAAPTPQDYNVSNYNNNVVSFDQIYKNYASQYGKNLANDNQSGIKKSSLGTTIVTPTANINTVQGQYQSAYADTINNVISTLLTETENIKNGDWGYDPTKDTALKMASEYAANSTLQSLAGSGVLNSSATAERVARIVSDLIPQYEQKAYERKIQYLSQLSDTAQLVMNLDDQQFKYWKDAKDREFEEKEFEYKKQQDALDNAWKRVDELGYVDNEASTVLGVKVGTLSGQARLAKEQQEFELNKMREQAQIEHANDVALAKLKSELDTQQSKALAEYNHQLNMSELTYKNQLDTQKSKEIAQYENDLKKGTMEYDYQLQNKYGTSSSKNNSKLSTYDDIIKNRFAEYDEYTKQYVVPDEDNYNQLGDYLDSLYASGAITQEEFLQLSAKYSKYSGQSDVTQAQKDANKITSAVYGLFNK